MVVLVLVVWKMGYMHFDLLKPFTIFVQMMRLVSPICHYLIRF